MSQMLPEPTMPSAAERVLVVVLNFNGMDDTLGCLASLRGQDWVGLDVLVIDNGSATDETARIVAAFPEVEVIVEPENLGWAGGNNVGLRRALAGGYGYVCLLNNDTVLGHAAIGEMVAAAGVIAAPCLVHPVIHYFDDPGTAQLFPGLPVGADAAAQARAEIAGIVEMDHAYGACLLMPVGLPRAIGLLDERFFLQLEEEDFFQRARRAGFGAFCAWRARMLHKESASFGGRVTAAKTYYQVRNTFLLAEKHARGMGDFAGRLKRLLWALFQRFHGLDPTMTSWGGFARRMLSGDAHARAARQGVADYLLRRFGRRG